jgi:hypothetical protein
MKKVIFYLFCCHVSFAQGNVPDVCKEDKTLSCVAPLLEASEYYKNYAGAPYVNAEFHPHAGHPIPGKVMLAYFDTGGEGISWHDSSPGNTGGFRAETDVDSKATHSDDGDKPTPLYPDAPPVEYGMHYVAWTADGEWLNLTVDIYETGDYEVWLFYSANGQTDRVSFSIDGVEKTPGGVSLPTTGYYHQWYEKQIAEVYLEKGRRVLTFNELRADGANFACLTFKRVTESSAITK